MEERGSLSALRLVLISQVLLACAAFAQDASTPQNAVAYCTYQDGNQLTVRYSDAAVGHKHEVPNGKVWSPGDVPMLLFTEVPLTVANVELAIGAYSMYVIPDRDKWTLIVNKSVAAGAAYDEKLDLVRVPMATGKLPDAQDPPRVSFAHIAPKMCSLRVDVGKTGAWADVFKEK